MRILMTGGTGLIGSAVCRKLIARGDDVVVLTRSADHARRQLGGRIDFVESLQEIKNDDAVDQVVNLAGEQIVGRRWTPKRKAEIRRSRIDLTAALIDWMGHREVRPNVLVSGSALGFYGDSGSVDVDESVDHGEDFGARLCRDWELQAMRAIEFGTRVCLVRTGLVLSAHGGMLQQVLLPFKWGLGGRVGSGRQMMSWIHIADQVAAILHLLDQPACAGAYNLTAPYPVSNTEFTKALGKTLRRPTLMTVPKFLLQAGLGEAAELLLGGARVLPRRLLDSGFQFQFSRLDDALNDLLVIN